MMWRLLALSLLAGCASPACPKTITLETGITSKYEVGEAPARMSTVIVKTQWDLRP